MEIGMKTVNMVGEDREKGKFNFEETELRLALPGGFRGGGGGGRGGGTAENGVNINGKRGFGGTTDLKHVPSAKEPKVNPSEKDMNKLLPKDLKGFLPCSKDPAKPPAKALVVGWPPVQSFRKNVLAVQKNSTNEESDKVSGSSPPLFVKVCMDGAPYLRKVDLRMYKSYQQLSDALGNMFSSFTFGNYGSQGMIDFMNESKLINLLNNTDYVPAYEDRDGDWMLVGDVPWEMFVDSCKRLRIMKGAEAIGLAPRAMEKCKKRS